LKVSRLYRLLHQPGVTAPMIGASKLRYLYDAVAELDVRLSEDEMPLLEELYQPRPILGLEVNLPARS
jgi:aryl-alcohol dehydrogenase (NADP+)